MVINSYGFYKTKDYSSQYFLKTFEIRKHENNEDVFSFLEWSRLYDANWNFEKSVTILVHALLSKNNPQKQTFLLTR